MHNHDFNLSIALQHLPAAQSHMRAFRKLSEP
jgi:hypothetical protein